MGTQNKFEGAPEDRTGDGAPIYRYGASAHDGEWRPAAQSLYGEEIVRHMEGVFPGREISVLHEIMSELVHIDVYLMHPSEREPFYVLFTGGMSDLAMTLPEDLLPQYQHLERAEVMIFLPADWNIRGIGGVAADTAQRDYWPVGLLKSLARFPHEYDTWLGHGHSMPNGEDYTPYDESTALCGVVLTGLRDDIGLMSARDGTPVNFYMAVPVYREEMEYKLEHGADALLDKIVELPGNPFVVDIDRLNTCGDWTFPFNEPLASPVLTCRHVLREKRPVLYVARDEDEPCWQFLCGEEHGTEEAMVVSLLEMVRRDPTLAQIADLPVGCRADREAPGDAWNVVRR